jgi:hypothetical protein
VGIIDERIKRRAQARNAGDPPLEEVMLMHVAQVCHEANRAYCKAMGDHSQVPFEMAPQWQISSAIKGVAFLLMNPEAGPEASHISWMAEKQAGGWVYGEEKDAEKKTHPCMIPFEQLPPEQQAKDYIFHAIVRAMMGGHGGL